jgi:hypothetical protein
VATSIDSSASNPNNVSTANPTKNGTIAPIDHTVKEAAPPLKNSLGVISGPATNKMTMADISPIVRTVSSSSTSRSLLKKSNPPMAKGPTIIPARSSFLHYLQDSRYWMQ